MIKDVENIINQSDYMIFFPVVDPFLDLSLPKLKNLHILYKSPPQKKPKNNYFVNQNKLKARSESLLEDKDTINYINSVSKKYQKKVAIMPFKPSSKIDLICQKQNWLKISNSRKLNLLLEDKISFGKICQKNHIKTIPFAIDKLNQNNIKKYQKQFNSQKLVIQVKTGWAGNSTFLADSDNVPIPKDSLVKFMPFITGPTIIQNGCVYKNDLITSPAGLQLNNPLHTTNIFATTGRSWPVHLSDEQINQIIDINLKLEKLLVKNNYAGFLGLDFIIDQSQVYLAEINPRLTASFNFYTHLELKNNLLPLLYLHIIQFLNLKINIDKDLLKNRFFEKNIKGSQITIRDDTGKIIKSTTPC